MDEYLKRETLLDLAKKIADIYSSTGFATPKIIKLIERLKKADVVEVKHGEWETGHFEGGIFDGTNFEKCNVCQFERLFDDIRFKTTYNYCPNCGAKMDKKEGAEG